MYNLTDISVIKGLMSRAGVSFSKSLGQNFITDPSVCPQLAEAAGLDDKSGVLEIGPGIGVLTCQLAMRAKKVLSVELDPGLFPILEKTLADFNNIEVLNGDIMKLDLPTLISEGLGGCETLHVCANLPYYITSPIIMLLLESRLPFKDITVMVQQEAGERLTAEIGSRGAGAVSVAVNYYAESRELFKVPRESFMPSPKVDSEVIQLRVRKEPPFKLTDEKFFFQMVKAAFAQRRKTAQNGISAGLSIPKQTVGEALAQAGLPSDVRAEKLTMTELFTLNEILYKLK